MAAALRSLQKLSSLGVAAAAATTLSYNTPSACDRRRRFEGKTIVITGGGGTFGRVGARYFAEQGAKVVLVDVNQAALDSVAKDVNGITTCACDVRDPTQVQAVIDACGRVDLLWNNAGYQGAMKPLLDYPGDDFQRVMDINVNQSILDFASKGRSGSIPQDSLEALNVVLKVRYCQLI